MARLTQLPAELLLNILYHFFHNHHSGWDRQSFLNQYQPHSKGYSAQDYLRSLVAGRQAIHPVFEEWLILEAYFSAVWLHARLSLQQLSKDSYTMKVDSGSFEDHPTFTQRVQMLSVDVPSCWTKAQNQAVVVKMQSLIVGCPKLTELNIDMDDEQDDDLIRALKKTSMVASRLVKALQGRKILVMIHEYSGPVCFAPFD
jgi:hypothetical protein